MNDVWPVGILTRFRFTDICAKDIGTSFTVVRRDAMLFSWESVPALKRKSHFHEISVDGCIGFVNMATSDAARDEYIVQTTVSIMQRDIRTFFRQERLSIRIAVS